MTDLVWYFLKLGSIGFGGPAALVGYMRRDLVDERKLIDEATYNLSIALAQIMPGPLAAQTAMAIGYFTGGVIGASLVGLAFILPSFLMVLGLSVAYVAYGGMPWMQAVFYGIGAVIIAIIAVAAYRLARGTNKRDVLLWGVSGVTFAATVWTGSELAVVFILSGLVTVLIRAWPGRRRAVLLIVVSLTAAIAIAGLESALAGAGSASGQPVLLQILLFFGKAGSFVFGSGLAIVPFLQQGVVHDFGWLTDHQFLDAVAVALITPGPVVITVAFIGYLVAGLPGATLAAIGIFLPVYVCHRGPGALVCAPSQQRAIARVCDRSDVRGQWRDRRCRRRPRTPGHLRLGDRVHRRCGSPSARALPRARGCSGSGRRRCGTCAVALLRKVHNQKG